MVSTSGTALERIGNHHMHSLAGAFVPAWLAPQTEDSEIY